jgi:hypothetical protein
VLHAHLDHDVDPTDVDRWTTVVHLAEGNVDVDEDGIMDECQSFPCPADIAPSGGDAQVGIDDLLLVITSWGS